MVDLNRIQIEGLEELLSNLLGVKIKFDVAIRMNKNSDDSHLVVNSQELKYNAGVLSSVFKSLQVSNFGGGVSDNKSGYWMPIHFSFKYEMGSNGAKIADFWYEFKTNKWEKL